MKRLQRAIIAILCVVCLAFGVVACGGGKDPDSGDKATYTVTVTGGTPMLLSTVTVQLLDSNGEEATTAKALSNGKASFSLKKGTYTVVLAAGAGFGEYVVQDGVKTLTASKTSTTIELKKEEAEGPKQTDYKVRFMLNSTTPFANGAVQICDETNACYPTSTDADGYANWNVKATTYHVIVLETNWPEGYYFDSEKYTLTATTREIVVTFSAYVGYSVTVVYAGEGENTEPAAGVEIKASAYDNDAMGGSNTVYATATTNEQGVATFSAPAADIWVDVVGGARADYVRNVGIPALIEKPMSGEASTPLTITLYPAGTSEYTCKKLPFDEPTTVSVTPTSSFVWYELNPTKGGEYTVTSSGTLNTYLNMYASSAGYVNTGFDSSNEEPNEYTQNADGTFTFVLRIDEQYISSNNRWVLRIGAENVEEAGTFTVTATRTGNYEEDKTPDPVTVNAEHIMAVADMPQKPAESNFKFLNYETESLMVNKGDDGYYHYNGADGPIVYASLGDKYVPAGFLVGGFNSAVKDENSLGWDLTDGKTYNYSYRGFVDAYCKSLNADGLHPLNDELKTFLELYGKHTLCRDDKSFFACGYYASIYKQLSNNTVTVGDYRFEVAAGETKTLTYVTVNLDGRITVTSGNVKLLDGEDKAVTKLVVSGEDTFKVVNEGSAAVTVVLHVEYNTADKQLTAIGSYLVYATANGEEYTFTAPEANDYAFTLSMEGCTIISSDDTPIADDAITLAKNQTITLKVYAPIGVYNDEVVTLTIAIAQNTKLALGANTVTGTDDGVKYTFTATEEGAYTVTYDATGEVWRETIEGSGVLTSGSTVNLEEGEVLALVCYPQSMEAGSVEFSVTLAKQ